MYVLLRRASSRGHNRKYLKGIKMETPQGLMSTDKSRLYTCYTHTKHVSSFIISQYFIFWLLPFSLVLAVSSLILKALHMSM